MQMLAYLFLLFCRIAFSCVAFGCGAARPRARTHAPAAPVRPRGPGVRGWTVSLGLGHYGFGRLTGQENDLAKINGAFVLLTYRIEHNGDLRTE